MITNKIQTIGAMTVSTDYVYDSLGQLVAETYTYDAYGNPTIYDASGSEILNQTSQIGNRYFFQGREYDSVTHLYYFRARYYNPITGRWLSKDPKGITGGLNLYVFVSNNPVMFVDPMGLCKDGEKYVQKYIKDLRKNWYLIFTPSAFAKWSTQNGRDLKIEDPNSLYIWRGKTFRTDQMGNAGAAYALADVYGPLTAYMITRAAENIQSMEDGYNEVDRAGSYEANDFGIEKWYESPRGQATLQIQEKIRQYGTMGH